MTRRKMYALAVVAGLVLSVTAVSVAVGSSTSRSGLDRNIVVTLAGPGELMSEPPIEGALCYETDLFNSVTNRVIGTGIDCLADIQEVAPGFLINRTTIFHFEGRGSLYANGPTSVVPTTGGSPSATHIVGDIPDVGASNIVGGTGAFRNATGSVRLSGAVHMGNFPDAIDFNCIFVIDLD